MLENKRIVIAGGGHAGIEAALAAAKQKVSCLLVSLDLSAIGRLSCNPAIGGLGKSHLVKEIDALGGITAEATDYSAIQYKMLNKTKGRAVWSLRVQVDKKQYPKYIKSFINKNKFIDVLEDEVVGFKEKKGEIVKAILKKEGEVDCSSLIITCGTFLNGLIHIGKKSFSAGRMGERPAIGLTESLKDFGFSIGRLKTGTPPRIKRASINWEKTSPAPGDSTYDPFSLFSPRTKIVQENCFIVNTNKKTHEIIKKNLFSSAMFSGKIKGRGPRYCPSVEDKIHRFNRDSHHLFLEPEWSNSSQIYLNGFSTSLSESSQIEALKTIEAFKNIQLIRPGYAIEYDYSFPYQLNSALESKDLKGLFFAGQINGTSGYEEAAAQGLVAGVNAAQYIKKEAPLFLSRKNSYIGVMIDDLITSHLDEPYRMFTSRAEHRLLLRSDNCYSRLVSFSKKFSLFSKQKRGVLNRYLKTKEFLLSQAETQKIKLPKKTSFLKDYIKRPDASLFNFFDKKTQALPFFKRACFEVETSCKYEGYIENENQRIEGVRRLETTKIPADFNYEELSSLSSESKERLALVRPETLGQCSRVFGVRPTDIILIASKIKAVSRETI